MRETKRPRERDRERDRESEGQKKRERDRRIERERCETVKTQKWYYLRNMSYAYFPINR